MSQFVSRRTFISILGGSLAVVGLSACATTKRSDQDAAKQKLADLRALDKYKEKKIDVGDNYFSPQETTIEPGTIVIWTNVGRSIHDVVQDRTPENKADDFTSDTLRRGDIHVWLFEEPGEFGYHCHFHGGPKRGQWGTLTVS